MANLKAPLYVKVGLFGVGSRAAAMMYFWLSIVLAIGLAMYFQSPFGLCFLLSALWYWAAIKWMDANDGWRMKS